MAWWPRLVVALLISLGNALEFRQVGKLSERRNFDLECHSTSTDELTWSRGGKAVGTGGLGKASIAFESLNLQDIGNYTCMENSSLGITNKTFELKFHVPVRLEVKKPYVEIKEGNDVQLMCSCAGFPLDSSIEWLGPPGSNPIPEGIQTWHNLTYLVSALHIDKIDKQHNGVYACKFKTSIANITLKVLSLPEISSFDVTVIGKSKLYLSWEIDDGNAALSNITLGYRGGSRGFVQTPMHIETNGSFVLRELVPDMVYSNFSLEVGNPLGLTKGLFNRSVQTLSEDPKFIPILSVNGLTLNTVTLMWNEFQNLTSFYHFFKVSVKAPDGSVTQHKTTDSLFMVENLRPGTSYSFVVQACSKYTNECDEVSGEVNGTTMDGKSSAPRNLHLECLLERSTQEGTVRVTWDVPEKPQGLISEYSITLNGNATYIGEDGVQIIDNIGTQSKTVQSLKVEFSGLLPNTLVFVSVCAKTRSRICGISIEGKCLTASSLPHRDELNKASWKLVHQKKKLCFMITIPHISRRNGSICCFRIVVVRLPEMNSLSALQKPEYLRLQSYNEVHASESGGAYVAEIIDPTSNARSIVIGDDDPTADYKLLSCSKCGKIKANPVTKGLLGHFRQTSNFNTMSSDRNHRKRHSSFTDYIYDAPLVHDGPLDSQSVYTAYLEAIVLNEKNEPLRAQSEYFTPLKPSENVMEDAYQPDVAPVFLSSSVITLAIIFLVIVCVMRMRRKERNEEGFGFSHSIQYWCHRFGGQQEGSCDDPADLPPVLKSDLVAGFLERHQDCDYGFQREFEILPDRFFDRTSCESDKRENIGKNRYPDIKAYDQTRVVLSRVDGVPTSDYINANFVMGYKERKKFICAQGPMECTIVDWWRMIWEQDITLIIMLTNIEEYNKSKCAKYWPAEGTTSVYGDISISEMKENKFSDYLIRRLTVSSNFGNSTDDSKKENREVIQYHYLVWKDFMAPEHPIGIIRFIKKFNQLYSPDKGPILVHCSAGVGRTGTLVALDSLLSELEETGSVAIFNTICDLRHQRNYLVQSLKQYVFVYRALMEVAQFGDTEIPISELKSVMERHNSSEIDKSALHAEFQKLTQVVEDRRPFSVGSSDENLHRNRHQNIIPYDRNRVILSPLPNAKKEICTYINASFVEGYDSSEQFIMTQDPLEATVGDFWRMIVEQNVKSIVVLSEIGEDACPRYWPEKDQETSHGHIRVKYMQSQSFPFYYRREFTITNSRTEDSFLVTQFQYNGWPVGIEQVPESARGLVELLDTTFKHKETVENLGPRVVHCSAGADRSCIFVALSILVQYVMNESVIDVFNVVRNLRAQRQGLFQNFAQYELLYRGLLTYSELHKINGTIGF